jgi:pimeloyl-ACP methyl ester carboxylesterase
MAGIADFYPLPEEVDAWCAAVMARAERTDLEVEATNDPVYDFRLGVRHTGGVYLEMRSEELGTFYCFWQTCPSRRGPVLLHTPGFGAELSAHPELVADGCNVLHINPLGYGTPHGQDESKLRDGTWPVWEETVLSLGRKGYVDWFGQAAAATLWALKQDEVEPDRFAFFGTSQGGRGAIVLGSIFRDRGVRAVAADVPGFTNYPKAVERRIGNAVGSLTDIVQEAIRRGDQSRQMAAFKRIAESNPDDLPAAVKAIGLIDPISHAPRMTMPTLLVAGGADTICPPEGILSMFQALPGTRSYTEVAGQEHTYTTPFLHLARAWFRLHV